MMKAVLKTLALSFGGGLALGAGLRLTQGSARARREPDVDLDPVLARLKNVESRIVAMEASPRAPSAAAAPAASLAEKTLSAFESRLAAQFGDVEQLRGEIRNIDQRLGDLDAHIPVIIQSTVDVRFQEVERKLQHDFEEAQNRSMAAFVDTLQSAVVERITALETNLADQSQAIGKLRDTSLRTDESLQKMLVGIERLVDQGRRPAPPPSAVPAPPAESPPAAVEHAAEPAVAHSEAAEQPEVLASHLAAVRLGSTMHRVDEKLPIEQPLPALVSEASMAAEPAHAIPVLTSAPETAQPGAIEAVHANGAVSGPAPASPNAEVHAAESAPEDALPQSDEPVAKSEESYEWVNRIGLELLAPRPQPRFGWRIPLAVGLVAGLILIAGLLYSGMMQRYFKFGASQQTSNLASVSPASEPAAPLPNGGDLQTLEQRAASNPGDLSALVELGREYTRRRDWTKAEAAYRSALEASPGNRDAGLGLSDVLYQEQKYEESAAVLNKLSSAKPQ